MSTETMQNIISYVDQYFCDKHTTPSVNEIALGVGIPKTTAFRYLVCIRRWPAATVAELSGRRAA